MAELKPICEEDRDSTRMHAALEIYRSTILPEAQNPERQILYWIAHCGDDIRDEFRCFSIHRGDNVVGYLQYSFFKEERLFFFEYLCLARQSRSGLFSKDALESIERFLTENYAPGFLIAFEVAHIHGDEGWRSDKKLVNYFTRMGFRKIDFPYMYPVLQSYDGDTSYPADLMVRLPNGDSTIQASDYRTIIRCLYFKHYLRWDRPFLPEKQFNERERLINELYVKQLSLVSGYNTLNTTGDDKISSRPRFLSRPPSIKKLLVEIFGDKIGEMVLISSILFAILMAIIHTVGNPWWFFPFMLIVFAAVCLAENTPASRKLMLQIISRVKPPR